MMAVFLTVLLSANAVASDVGAGFFVTHDGYFVTSLRAVINAGSNPIVIRDKFEDQFTAVMIATDKVNNLALLKAEGSFAAMPIVKFGAVNIGDQVLAIAPRSGERQHYGAGLIKGRVKNLTGLQGETNVFSVSLPRGVTQPGGPLLTAEGNVIGVITAGGGSPADATIFAVKSDQLLALLATENAARVQLLPFNETAALTYGQLAKTIKRAVGMVQTATPSTMSPQPLDAEINTASVTTASLPATYAPVKSLSVASANVPDSAEEMYKAGHNALSRQDYRVAYKWLSQAADQGHAKAEAALASLYLKGQGTDKDPAAAANWFRKAALQGEIQAGENLGILFLDGLGVNQDDIEAAWWFERAAKQGSASAQANLALLYEDGRGVRQDDAEAVQWFRQAAEQGNALAQYRLGIHYIEGRGVEKNEAEASRWLSQSAEQGFAQALDYLRASGVVLP